MCVVFGHVWEHATKTFFVEELPFWEFRLWWRGWAQPLIFGCMRHSPLMLKGFVWFCRFRIPPSLKTKTKKRKWCGLVCVYQVQCAFGMLSRLVSNGEHAGICSLKSQQLLCTIAISKLEDLLQKLEALDLHHTEIQSDVFLSEEYHSWKMGS